MHGTYRITIFCGIPIRNISIWRTRSKRIVFNATERIFMQSPTIQRRIIVLTVASLFTQPGLAAQAAESELPDVVVRAAGTTADPVAGGRSAAKLDVPLRDIPQSVQDVPKELIREQGALEMKEALRNVSGGAPAQGEGRRDQFLIRGFDATRDTLVDGMRDDSLYFRDLGNVERIEVLKGPAAVLYGRGSAGGVMNRITKKPVRESLREAGLSIGSEQLRRLDVDLGGTLGPQAAFRLTGAHEVGDSFRDLVHSERSALAPSISWSAGHDTRFLLQTEFLHQRRTPDRGIPSLGAFPADVPINNFYGEQYDFATTDARNARLSAEHAFSDRLTLRNQFQYSTLSLDAVNTRTLGLTADRTQVRRQITYFPQDQTNYLNQTEAEYKMGGGSVRHTLLGGIELGYQKTNRLVRAGNSAPVSLQAPQHGLAPPNLTNLPLTIDSDFAARTAAVYAQDLISFGSHWKALAGVRFDRFTQMQHDHRSGPRQERTDSISSPRLGVVYQPGTAHSLYANLSRSFQPAGTDLFYGVQDMADIKPLESLQQETGVKSEWFGGRLLSNVALYRITQRNMVTKDPADPAGLRQVQTGEQQSRGLELDVSGTLGPGWKIFASYTLNLARLTQSNNFAIGNRPANIPKHAASLWISRALGGGFTIGTGAFYVGDRYATEDNTVKLPSFVRVDAMLGYKAARWEAGLNINNIPNRKYYESANNNHQIQPGAPRNAMLFIRANI
jgi:catecholate siderophore receptor